MEHGGAEGRVRGHMGAVIVGEALPGFVMRRIPGLCSEGIVGPLHVCMPCWRRMGLEARLRMPRGWWASL